MATTPRIPLPTPPRARPRTNSQQVNRTSAGANHGVSNQGREGENSNQNPDKIEQLVGNARNSGGQGNNNNNSNENRNLSLNKIINPQLKNKYSRLRTIELGLVQKDAWEDYDLEVLDHLDIAGYQNSSIGDQAAVVRHGLKSLYKSVSVQSVGMLLASAWLLRSPYDPSKYVFSKVTMMGSTTSVANLSNSALVDAAGTDNLDELDDNETVLEGAYLCAAAIRLLTKEANNLRNAWSSVKRNFANFYREDMALDIEPDIECLEKVRLILQNRTVIKQTVSLFLLNIKNLEGQSLGMCKMLFEIHLCYAGMHAFSLLLYCVAHLKVPLEIFFQCLKHPHHSDALKMAERLLCDYLFPVGEEAIEEARKRSTWKYARLFDSTAFSSLQTKNCTQLTAILAVVAKKIGPRNSGDATQIHQISNMVRLDNGWLDNGWLDRVSDNLITFCKNAGYADAGDISVTRLKNEEIRKNKEEEYKYRR